LFPPVEFLFLPMKGEKLGDNQRRENRTAPNGRSRDRCLDSQFPGPPGVSSGFGFIHSPNLRE
jgi:hypothetical protein